MRFFIVVLCVIAISCSPAPVETVPVSQEFDLKFGEIVTIHGEPLSIKFTTVVDDSRCPIGVICIWEGNAQIRLRLETPDVRATEVSVNTSIDPGHVLFAGYTIQLKMLSPYPVYAQAIDTAAYVARLIVTK